MTIRKIDSLVELGSKRYRGKTALTPAQEQALADAPEEWLVFTNSKGMKFYYTEIRDDALHSPD